jgi:hypothetical protein
MTSAVHEITTLIYEYAFRLDAGDLDGAAALFAHADLRSSRGGRVLHGQAGMRSLLEPVIIGADGTPGTVHQMTNVTVQVDGSGATARTYFTVLSVTGQGLHPILAGEYRDRFEHVDGAWRFTERTFVPLLRGDMSGHVRG